MKYILSGTNRVGSRTLEISKLIQGYYKELGEMVEIIDLKTIPMHEVQGDQYSDKQPPGIANVIAKLNASTGIIIVTPEYNGSMPGVLKYFIDHWKYPDTFEYRPVCFVGLGGRFGGLRPVEHLQHVFGYRNSFVYPERVFLVNIWSTLKEGALHDKPAVDLLKLQAVGFQKFVQALESQGLDANAVIEKRAQK